MHRLKITRRPTIGSKLALQLRFLRSSESIGHHDSEIVDDGYFDRDDAGALGVIAAGYQSADGAIVHPGAGGNTGIRNSFGFRNLLSDLKNEFRLTIAYSRIYTQAELRRTRFQIAARE